MQQLYKALAKNPIVYVVRDIERALGLPLKPGYHIVTNKTAFAKVALAKNKNVCLIAEEHLLSTLELLKHPAVQKYIERLPNAHLVVFKNTPIIERWCEEHNLKLLNPPAALSTQVEEKISQLDWLGELATLLPPHKKMLGKDLPALGFPYIVQFNRAHTGQGTFLVRSVAEALAIGSKFPHRPVRLTQFIAGNVFTLNALVWGKAVLSGPISYQITGLKPFTENPFATIGNDWALPKKLITGKQTKEIGNIVQAVGKKLMAQGWRGLFGIDVLVANTGNVYLLEVNARQAAGASFESRLQEKNAKGKKVTTFAAHLAALLQLPYKKEVLAPVVTGAQLVARIPELAQPRNQKKVSLALKKLRCTAVTYDNNKPGEDFVRAQTVQSVMAASAQFNPLGERIAAAVI
jgi:hypothetical protein